MVSDLTVCFSRVDRRPAACRIIISALLEQKYPENRLQEAEHCDEDDEDDDKPQLHVKVVITFSEGVETFYQDVGWCLDADLLTNTLWTSLPSHLLPPP